MARSLNLIYDEHFRMSTLEESIKRAAAALAEAKTIIITAGAGMGVDSGLPDFRGSEGFWRAYPPYARLGLNFESLATPRHLVEDPEFGWGFYGHRTMQYRAVVPHQGFAILRNWTKQPGIHCHVITSNIDGQFQKSHFSEDEVVEIHGSIHHLQCTAPCAPKLWPNNHQFEIDLETMRTKDIPYCSNCQSVARPNVLMFGDFQWIERRTRMQEERFNKCTDCVDCKQAPVIIELGAGKAIPSIRWIGERMVRNRNAKLIRINTREAEVPDGQISIALGAREALERISENLA